MKLKIWKKTEGIYLADGSPCTPDEVMEKWPFAKNFPVVLEMAGPLVVGIDSLPMLETIYSIDESLSEADKLAAIQVSRERAQNPDYDAINEILDMLESDGEDE